jgi:hypothetical protein
MTPAHHRYWETTTFTRYQDGFPPGWHRFRFVFDDGMATVVTDPDSFEVIGTAVEHPRKPVRARGEPAVRPNPFRDIARIVNVLPGATAEVRGATGRVIFRRRATSGCDALEWDGRDPRGRKVPPGVYFVTVREPGHATRIRVVRAGD